MNEFTQVGAAATQGDQAVPRSGVPMRRSWRRPPAWTVQLTAVLVAVVLTGVYLQLTHPFLRHDDWEYTLDRGEPGATNILGRNKYEGRWLNWVYWGIIGQHTTIVVAMAIFFVAYTAYVCGAVRLFDLRQPLHVFLATLAFMVSAVWVRLAYWPGTLSASMLVAATAVWTLPLARRRRGWLVAWLVVFTVAALLTYPPVAGLVLLALAVSERRASVRRIVALGLATWSRTASASSSSTRSTGSPSAPSA